MAGLRAVRWAGCPCGPRPGLKPHAHAAFFLGSRGIPLAVAALARAWALRSDCLCLALAVLVCTQLALPALRQDKGQEQQLLSAAQWGRYVWVCTYIGPVPALAWPGLVWPAGGAAPPSRTGGTCCSRGSRGGWGLSTPPGAWQRGASWLAAREPVRRHEAPAPHTPKCSAAFRRWAWRLGKLEAAAMLLPQRCCCAAAALREPGDAQQAQQAWAALGSGRVVSSAGAVPPAGGWEHRRPCLWPVSAAAFLPSFHRITKKSTR
jgi:hypothetical protein